MVRWDEEAQIGVWLVVEVDVWYAQMEGTKLSQSCYDIWFRLDQENRSIEISVTIGWHLINQNPLVIQHPSTNQKDLRRQATIHPNWWGHRLRHSIGISIRLTSPIRIQCQTQWPRCLERNILTSTRRTSRSKNLIEVHAVKEFIEEGWWETHTDRKLVIKWICSHGIWIWLLYHQTNYIDNLVGAIWWLC